jgi:hypothetical protein
VRRGKFKAVDNLNTMPAPWSTRLSTGRYAIAATGVIVLVAVTLLLMGRTPVCKCGYVKLWHGLVYSAENSQQIFDWYSFSHVIHGVVFYAVLWLVGRDWRLSTRFVLALAVEGAWEVFENTDFVINRYRTVTISLDYYGDSVINSVADIFAMMLGFGAARVVPVWGSVALVIALEGFVAYFIRDNLMLNIIMLLYPVEWIREWQFGAGHDIPAPPSGG